MKIKALALAFGLATITAAGAAHATPYNGAFVIDISSGGSLSVSGGALNISYPGGPGQTWSNQTATSFSGWADLPQTGGTFTGTDISFCESSLTCAANVSTTTPFYLTGAATFPSGGHTFDSVQFQPGSYALTNGGTLTVSAAPEPAAWALMMLGVAGLGVALRSSRRRKIALSSAALA